MEAVNTIVTILREASTVTVMMDTGGMEIFVQVNILVTQT